MGLFPSNMIAEEVNGGVKVFANVARRIARDNPEYPYKSILLPEAPQIVQEVKDIIIAELVEAGIPHKMNGEGVCGMFDMSFDDVESLRMSNGYFPEVPSKLIGFYNKWKFERRWYYYVAEGAGIPPEFAIPFDKEWGRQVRVHGDCGCRGAEFWGEGFGIDMYHIDTPAGLKAFIGLLDKVYKPHPRE